MKNTRWAAAIGAVGALALTVTACAGSPEEGPERDTLLILNSESTVCADPHQNTSRSMLQWGRNVVDSLIFIGMDAEPHPWLATEWEVNDDATEYRFTIRDDVEFWDGSPMEPGDVKATFDALSEMSESRLAVSALEKYAGTTVEGDGTVVVAFSEPNPSFLYNVSTPALGIMSAETFDKTPAEMCELDYNATGPYQITDFVLDESMTLTANESYAWGAENWENTAAAAIKTIKISVVDVPLMAGLAESGQADILQNFNNAAADEINRLEAAGWHNSPASPAVVLSLFVKLDQGIAGADESVRKAIQIGINRADLESVISPANDVATGVLNETHPYYVDQSELLAYDPDEASRILDEAGWEVGADGIRVKDGQRLTVETLSTLSGGSPALTLVQQQLTAIGVDLQIAIIDVPTEAARRADGTWQMRFSASTNPEPTAIWSGIGDAAPSEETIALYNEQARLVDIGARKEIVTELVNLLAETAQVIPLEVLNNTPWLSPGINGQMQTLDSLLSFSNITFK